MDDSLLRMLVAELLNLLEPLFVGTMNKLFRKSVHHISLTWLSIRLSNACFVGSQLLLQFFRFKIRKQGLSCLACFCQGILESMSSQVVFHYDDLISLVVIQDIRELLTSWNEHLQIASHIFLYAPSSNAQTLFGGENAVLDRNDRRIRRIPFTTRRPTMKEAKRISYLLSLLQSSDLDTLERSDGVGALRGEDSSNVPLQTVDKKRLKSRQEESHAATEQVGDSRIDLEDPGLTPLHIAAKEGDTEKVMKLLEEDADPCIKDKGGKNPYSLAKDKETRNVFRRCMAQHPDKWDWHAASVPSPLTDELEAAQIAKQVHVLY